MKGRQLYTTDAVVDALAARPDVTAQEVSQIVMEVTGRGCYGPDIITCLRVSPHVSVELLGLAHGLRPGFEGRPNARLYRISRVREVAQ
jgi:hypothetical protein